jgi:hypothetical protein
LLSDSFQFTREDISEKREVTIDMKTTAKISKILTFGIYGRDFLKDGGPVNEANGGVPYFAVPLSLGISVAVYLYIRHYC